MHLLLSELFVFYEMTALPKVFWAVVARTHLAWKPRKSWDRELEHLQSQPGATAFTWEHFVLFMKRPYASLLPAREARQRYDRLKQSGSASDFVREQVPELEGTPYHPGGSMFDDFMNGLKADVRRFVEEHAPTGWWTNIQDLYQKAVDYEINDLARTGTSSGGGGGQQSAQMHIRLNLSLSLVSVAMQAEREVVALFWQGASSKACCWWQQWWRWG